MMRAVFLLAALAATGCGYTPPRGTDTASGTYRTDLDACEASVPDAVDKRNAKTGLSWFAGGVTRWGQIGDAKAACMGAKGWGRVRTCTAEELRQGRSGAGNLVATARGIQCSDPGKTS